MEGGAGFLQGAAQGTQAWPELFLRRDAIQAQKEQAQAQLDVSKMLAQIQGRQLELQTELGRAESGRAERDLALREARGPLELQGLMSNIAATQAGTGATLAGKERTEAETAGMKADMAEREGMQALRKQMAQQQADLGKLSVEDAQFQASKRQELFESTAVLRGLERKKAEWEMDTRLPAGEVVANLRQDRENAIAALASDRRDKALESIIKRMDLLWTVQGVGPAQRDSLRKQQAEMTSYLFPTLLGQTDEEKPFEERVNKVFSALDLITMKIGDAAKATETAFDAGSLQRLLDNYMDPSPEGEAKMWADIQNMMKSEKPREPAPSGTTTPATTENATLRRDGWIPIEEAPKPLPMGSTRRLSATGTWIKLPKSQPAGSENTRKGIPSTFGIMFQGGNGR